MQSINITKSIHVYIISKLYISHMVYHIYNQPINGSINLLNKWCTKNLCLLNTHFIIYWKIETSLKFLSFSDF